MAQDPAPTSVATTTTLDGFELALSSRSSTGYKWVNFKYDCSGPLQKPYHAQFCVRRDRKNHKINLGYHKTAAGAALAVAKYRSGNHGNKELAGDVHKKSLHKKQRMSPSSVVTCTAVEVEASEEVCDAVEVEATSEECDVCQLATDRILEKAKPWHIQALLADFGAKTDGSPAELARRLADQLISQ